MFVGSKKYLKSREFKDLKVVFRKKIFENFFFFEKVTFSHIFKSFFHFKVKVLKNLNRAKKPRVELLNIERNYLNYIEKKHLKPLEPITIPEKNDSFF